MVQGTVQFLTFRLDDRLYGLRLSQADRVIRSVDCTPLPNAPPMVLGVIDVHGAIIAVLDVRRRFGLPPHEIGVDDQFIIAHTSNRTVALVVQSVTGMTQRSADEVIAAETVAAGGDSIDGVMQSGGELVLIYNLERFLSSADERVLTGALQELSHGRDIANQPAE